MEMFDTIHKIEDFKKMLQNIWAKKPDIRKDLRITIQEKALSDMAIQVSIILTLPKNDTTILRHYVGRKIFNRYFYKDVAFDDFKQCNEFIKECYAKVEKHFGKVTEGYWSET